MPARARCPVCRRTFRPARSDARYCSGACRQRAYRLRQRTWRGLPDGTVLVDGEVAGIVVRADGDPLNWVEWTATGVEAVTVGELLPVGYRVLDRRRRERRQGDRRSGLDRRG